MKSRKLVEINGSKYLCVPKVFLRNGAKKFFVELDHKGKRALVLKL